MEKSRFSGFCEAYKERSHRSAQRFQAVATLQDRNQRAFSPRLPQHRADSSEAFVGDPHPAEGVLAVCVEPRGDEPCPRMRRLEDPLAPCGYGTGEDRIVGTGGQREVAGEAAATPTAGLVRSTTARVEGVVVHGEVEDVVALPEVGLGAIAVVNVEVNDRHGTDGAREELLGGNGNVVEEAKAHRPVAQRMV